VIAGCGEAALSTTVEVDNNSTWDRAMMRVDWYFEAMQAEIDYRTEKLRRAAWPRRHARRQASPSAASPGRGRGAKVRIPEQRRGEHQQTAACTR